MNGTLITFHSGYKNDNHLYYFKLMLGIEPKYTPYLNLYSLVGISSYNKNLT